MPTFSNSEKNQLRKYAKEQLEVLPNTKMSTVLQLLGFDNETEFYNEMAKMSGYTKRPKPLGQSRSAVLSRLRKQKASNQQEANEFLQSLDVDIPQSRPVYDEPIQTSIKHFRNYNQEIEIKYPTDNQPLGDRSLNILNRAIPILMKALKSNQGMKVNFTFGLEFTRDDSIVPYPNISPPEIITNQDEINPYIQNTRNYILNYIPEMEGRGSGLIFRCVEYIVIHIMKYNPLRISSYLPLPKHIASKKCCINIKNEDEKCLMYCVKYHFQKPTCHPERVSHYKKPDGYDWDKIKFPVAIKDIGKVEELVSCAINVYDEDKRPLRISTLHKDGCNEVINLLVIGDSIKGVKHLHYVYINKFDIFATENKYNKDGKHTHSSRYICNRCLHPFSTPERLNHHITMGCDQFEPTRSVLPVQKENGPVPSIKFEHHTRKFKAPVVIYADFETLIKQTGNVHDESKSSTTKLSELPPCSFCFNVVSDFPELNFGVQLYRGEDAVEVFIDKLLEVGNRIERIFTKNTKMIMTSEDEKNFKTATICSICDKHFAKNSVKVRDHCHITGKYRGCAHEDCNLNFNYKNYKVPVYFHNLKGFDGHLVIQGLHNRNFENIRIIAQNFEKYMSFSFANLMFLDSFAFLSSSLDTLASNLLKDGKDNFQAINGQPYNEVQKEILLQKGVYPYEYIDSFEKFQETELPPIEAFYSQLADGGIKEEEYERAKVAWKEFNIQNLGEYHDLYLKTDVLLLTDVFEAFRKTAMKNYKLDPANGYFTLPNFAWDAMLKMTKVKLELLTDIDMYQMVEKGIRGGISMISHRYAKANNKYMNDFNPEDISSYIVYLDANNLYGQAMVQKLPVNGFQFVEMGENEILNFDADGDEALIVECDLHYPTHLHDLHNNYPLAPEKRSIKKSELSPYQLNQCKVHNEKHNEKIEKLVPNLYDKNNYVVHIKNLQYYLSKGLVMTKVHRVIKFNQSQWLKPYIDFNTEQRKLSKNDFEKDLYKLMNNAVFGKTMEDMRNRVDIKLYTDEKLVEKQVAKPQFMLSKIYSENLVAIKSVQKLVKLNKPIYVGLSVLDLSKLHMYQFHYDFIKPKYQDKAKLLFTDTDSLTYHIETEDLYKDMKENKELFDFSDYSGEGYLAKDNTNKKVIGKFKDETEGVPIAEFCGLRSKMYSVLLDNGKEKKTGKGIKKLAMKKYISHEDYKRCLFSSEIKDQRQLVSFNNLRSIDHNIGMYRFTKVGLSCSNDKQFLLGDGITSLSYGHYSIMKQ